MAASIPPPTFEKLRHVCAFNRGSILLNLCANCSLFDAIFSNQIISFKDLLQVFCGGSLVQHCSFCDATMTVEAVDGEVKGCNEGVPVVSLLPHMTQMYCCLAPACEEEMDSKVNAWRMWRNAIALAHNKLIENHCNFCFKLAEEVHR